MNNTFVILLITLITLFLLVGSIVLYLFFRYRPYFLHYGMQLFSVGFGYTKKVGNKLEPIGELTYLDSKKANNVDFIADPCWIKEKGIYYLFVEAAIDLFGRIDVYSSKDFINWELYGTALEIDTHLSYPLVFRYNDEIYMMPESNKAKEVALYETDNFPLGWKKKRVLIDKVLVDSSILFYNDLVYIFAADSDYNLYVYYSDDILNGEFKMHPKSPLGRGEGMRPAGRPIILDGKIVLPMQSHKKGYGYSIKKLVITYLDTQTISYHKGGVWFKPLKNSKFFRDGVHHVDIQKDGDGYRYTFDGRSGISGRYIRNNTEKAIKFFKDDIYTFKRIRQNNN